MDSHASTHARTHAQMTTQSSFHFEGLKRLKLRNGRLRNNCEEGERKAVKKEVMKNESDENWV